MPIFPRTSASLPQNAGGPDVLSIEAQGSRLSQRRRQGLLAGLGLLAISVLGQTSDSASAATVDGTIGITSTVQATCVTTTTPMDFGTYTGVQADGTATISITCTNSTPYSVGLSPGLGTGATITDRSMMNGAALLNYGLFSNTERTANWGDTVETGAMAAVATGAAQPMTIYGRTVAGQYVAPGIYNDTITATVTY